MDANTLASAWNCQRTNFLVWLVLSGDNFKFHTKAKFSKDSFRNNRVCSLFVHISHIIKCLLRAWRQFRAAYDVDFRLHLLQGSTIKSPFTPTLISHMISTSYFWSLFSSMFVVSLSLSSFIGYENKQIEVESSLVFVHDVLWRQKTRQIYRKTMLWWSEICCSMWVVVMLLLLTFIHVTWMM